MIKFIFKDSKNRTVFGEGSKYPKIGKGFLWLQLFNPSNKEIKKVTKDFKINKKIFKRYSKERKSVRYYFRPLSFVLVDYYVENDKMVTRDVLYIVGKNYLITVTKNRLKHYDEIFELIKTKILTIKDVGYLLYEILDFDVETTYNVLNLTEKKVSDLEKDILVLKDIKRKITDVIELKRKLLIMWRRLWSSSKIVFSIKKGFTPINIDNDLLGLLNDVHDAFIHQMEIASTQREVLTDALTIYEAVLANRLAIFSNTINISVKRLTWVMFILTGITAILSVPNLMAAIFQIPALPLTISDLQPILIILAVSTIIPTILFYFYWKRIKQEENR